MADLQKGGLAERDIDQAITALKKGAYLLKYGRRGKPKFCPFHLSNDESKLIWYSGKEEKHIKLGQVSRIIPGQRTVIFQRYPRPEKEYQSFSLLYNDRSLDLICKDKDEAEVWFIGLKALISGGTTRKWRIEAKSDCGSIDSPKARNQKNSPISIFDPGDAPGTQAPYEAQSRLGKAFADIITQTATIKSASQPDLVDFGLLSAGSVETTSRSSGADAIRVSLSSAVSSSSHGSCHEDFDALGDVFIWGQGVGDGVLGCGVHKVGDPFNSKIDALLPKALESTVVLDVHNIACGGRHAVLVTKQGEIFSWGEESGGRLGHGMEADVSNPKLIDTLSGMNFESVACGEYHTCAVTVSGDLFTWGDGTHNSGLLGHGSEASHWIPKKVSCMEGIHVSYISCGPWHTALVTSGGRLFTFGDGTFGALGHGNYKSTTVPREVETLSGMRTIRVACGVWHTAAVVEVVTEASDSGSPGSCSSGKLFTWGDGDKGQLGHGDKEPRLFPECIAYLVDENICRVACGHNLTVALTTSGRVYTMGCSAYGQLGSPTADGKVATRVEGNIANSFVEDVACGSYHVAILTSKTEVYTWGKGTNGQLGHGDIDDRNTPTVVDFLKDKQVKSVACGSNFTAIICLHKWVSSADHSMCSACRNPFGFRRKRHNCYNCGLVFCKVCTSRKSLKASLAPTTNKPYRVCDDCFAKLRKSAESVSALWTPKARNGTWNRKFSEMVDREASAPRLQKQLSVVSSSDSSNQAESRNFKRELKLEFQSRSLFPTQNGHFHLGGFYSPKVSTSKVGDSKKNLPASIASSRKTSRATSPASGKSSPNRSSEVTLDDSKQMNESLNQEIINLRAQVEELTFKSQRLEAELVKTSRQLMEVSAIAENEAEKCKSAKEVIRSLTAQLQEVADKLPAEQSAHSNSTSTGKRISKSEQLFSSASPASMLPTGSEVNGNSEIIYHGAKGETENSELVIQDEPGVYITLLHLPDHSNELKRVRFSRKFFTEEQAEKWWAENGAKVCERHNIRNTS